MRVSRGWAGNAGTLDLNLSGRRDLNSRPLGPEKKEPSLSGINIAKSAAFCKPEYGVESCFQALCRKPAAKDLRKRKSSVLDQCTAIVRGCLGTQPNLVPRVIFQSSKKPWNHIRMFWAEIRQDSHECSCSRSVEPIGPKLDRVTPRAQTARDSQAVVWLAKMIEVYLTTTSLRACTKSPACSLYRYTPLARFEPSNLTS